LIRLNVESRGSQTLMQEKTTEILQFLNDLGAEEPGH
jgi:hypothetical protein